LIVNGSFKIPAKVKYPSIPCFVDETTTVYPLEGSCMLTGPEYIVAKNQGCDIKIKSAFYIPPTEKPQPKVKVKKGCSDVKKVEFIKPFYGIFKEIQRLRREHSKGNIMNLLY